MAEQKIKIYAPDKSNLNLLLILHNQEFINFIIHTVKNMKHCT